MALLRAAEFAPFLFLTLPAGVWADLGIRKRLMISSNLIRAVINRLCAARDRSRLGTFRGSLPGDAADGVL